MPFKIVRNDITKMDTQAIVNTANAEVTVGSGCDWAVYQAAGYEKLLSYRREHIGPVPEGEVFITPGFLLPAEVIIHAVSPLYEGGNKGEEEKLRSCYRKSLALANEHHIRSIAFPLISAGGFGYPKEEAMRIAADEIHAFLLSHEMEIFLVVFDAQATDLGSKLYADLEEYIDQNYVKEAREEEYGPSSELMIGSSFPSPGTSFSRPRPYMAAESGENVRPRPVKDDQSYENARPRAGIFSAPKEKAAGNARPRNDLFVNSKEKTAGNAAFVYEEDAAVSSEGRLSKALEERMKHLSDTFSEYLMYLIQQKGLKNSEVYTRAIIDRKVFSKIKTNRDYHPNKLTAMCLCVGAKLNLDEARDLLARAGYALSPCDRTDIIFSYFIENQIYDMIELDIQLEEHGLPCMIE